HGDGIVKTFYDDTPVYSAAQFEEGLTEDLLAMLLQNEAVEVLAKTETEAEGLDPMTGLPAMVKAWDIKYRVKKADGRFVVIAIPPEDFLISDEATSLEDAAF